MNKNCASHISQVAMFRRNENLGIITLFVFLEKNSLILHECLVLKKHQKILLRSLIFLHCPLLQKAL